MTGRGSPKAPPVVANSEAFVKATAAAQAIGLSVEELADLLVDGGVTALPPADGITSRYSLEDLGLRLWGEMQRRSPSRRAEWFHGLAPTQRTAIVVVLRDRGFASSTVAREFSIPEQEVVRAYNAHADDLGAQVVGLRLNTIAGQMTAVYERAMEIEAMKDNGRAMWAIEKERIGVLQSLGIVEQAVHRSEITHKFDDVAKAEIEALAALRNKQRIRAEEIKQIEDEVVESEAVGKLEFERED